MRIAFLSPASQLGGAERCLLDLFAALREVRPDWILWLIASGEGPLLQKAEALGVRVRLEPYPRRVAELGEVGASASGWNRLRLASTVFLAGGALLRYAGRLRRAMEEIRPALVHSNGLKMHILSHSLMRSGEARVIWHMHEFISQRRMSAALLRRAAVRGPTVVTVSDAVLKDVKSVLGPALTAERIYNGVDLDRFSPEGPVADLDLLSGLPPAPDALRVGLLATMGPWKGHESFLEAVAQLPGDVPVRAYLVGGAIYETASNQQSLDRLQSLASELGIADRVGFTGFVEDTGPVIRALDVVVHASTRPEPFGLVIAEAMACGRSVISSGTGGSRELLTPGEDGLLFSAGNPRHLAKQILRLAVDPGLRSRLGENARRTARARFDRMRFAGQVADLYDRLTSTAIG